MQQSESIQRQKKWTRSAGPARNASPRRFLVWLVMAMLGLLLLGSGCAGPARDAAPAPTAEASALASSTKGSARSAQTPATPPFYRVTSNTGPTLLILGTIHLGPEEGWTLSPAIETALSSVDEIVLELDLRDATEEAVSTLVANLVMLEPPDTLPSVVSPETAKLLDEKDAMLTSMGMPRRMRDQMKPWFVAIGLIESATAQSGYATNSSMEGRILDALGGRPLIGLETFEFQMNMLDGLSPTLQDIMLYDTLARLEETVAGIEELVGAWRTGDEAALLAIARQGVDEIPELEAFYQVLLDDRNERWSEALGRVLEDESRAGATILVGVGALHVVGPRSLPSLLREAGYGVAPIEHFPGHARMDESSNDNPHERATEAPFR